MNTKIDKMLIAITCIVVLATITVFAGLFKSTYSISDKYVVFRGVGAHDNEIIKSCKIGTDGKLASSCISIVTDVCSKWTSGNMSGSEVNLNGTFNETTNVYCKSGSSDASGYAWGCYKCPTDATIIKWLVYAGSNSMPSSMLQDSNCSTTLEKVASITDDKECVPPESACYECKADSHKMKWSTNGDGDNKCPGGYSKTTKTQAQCVDETEACYECKADSSILEWRYNATGDSKCSGGYRKTTKTKAECKVEVPNPPTGTNGIFFTWIAAIIAITCSVWYLKKGA